MNGIRWRLLLRGVSPLNLVMSTCSNRLTVNVEYSLINLMHLF